MTPGAERFSQAAGSNDFDLHVVIPAIALGVGGRAAQNVSVAQLNADLPGDIGDLVQASRLCLRFVAQSSSAAVGGRSRRC